MGPWSKQNGDKRIRGREIVVAQDFIERYVRYAGAMTDAPKEYHEAVSFFCVATAMQGNFVCELSVGDYRPHVMIILLGDSTKYRKSTSIKIGQKLLFRSKIPFLPSHFTVEGMLERLEDNPRSGLIRDEFSGFIRDCRKAHMDGTKEFICSLYDGTDIDKSLKTKQYYIRSPSVCFLASTVPENFADAIDPEDFQSGFVPRFLMIHPELSRVKSRPITHRTERQEVESNVLMDTLQFIKKKFASDVYCVMGESILQLLNDWVEQNEKDEMECEDRSDMSAWFGRLNDYVIKIAMIREASYTDRKIEKDKYGNGFIRMHIGSMEYAIKWMSGYKKRYMTKVRSYMNFHFNEKVYGKIVELSVDGKDVKYSDLLRALKRVTTEDVKKALYTLIDMERIEKVNTGKRGIVIKLKR